MPKTYDSILAVAAQNRYCDEHELPLFAPTNGWCFNCGCNIYEPYTYRGREDRTSGISVEEAGAKLITSCPHCGVTFTD